MAVITGTDVAAARRRNASIRIVAGYEINRGGVRGSQIEIVAGTIEEIDAVAAYRTAGVIEKTLEAECGRSVQRVGRRSLEGVEQVIELE